MKRPKRLRENGGVCDGCGRPIGRWTSKCLYVEERDLALCNVGGCVETWYDAPGCASCEDRVNPFADETLMTQGGALCGSCVSKTDGGSLPPGYAPVDPPEGAPVEEGPFRVARPVWGAEGVVHVLKWTPGLAPYVRSSLYPERAFEKAAEFNTSAG